MRRSSSSAKIFAERLITDGGDMEGGRRSPSRMRPGKISLGVEKEIANPKVKKLGESPGLEKISRDIWKSRPPIWMKISDSKSCEVKRGTRCKSVHLACPGSASLRLTTIKLRVCEELDEMCTVTRLYIVACSESDPEQYLDAPRRNVPCKCLEMSRNVVGSLSIYNVLTPPLPSPPFF